MQRKSDYKALHNLGNTPFLIMGKTAVSEHITSYDHSEGDNECKILDFKSNWQKRLMKETIAISRLKMNFNDKELIQIFLQLTIGF